MTYLTHRNPFSIQLSTLPTQTHFNGPYLTLTSTTTPKNSTLLHQSQKIPSKLLAFRHIASNLVISRYGWVWYDGMVLHKLKQVVLKCQLSSEIWANLIWQNFENFEKWWEIIFGSNFSFFNRFFLFSNRTNIY